MKLYRLCLNCLFVSNALTGCARPETPQRPEPTEESWRVQETTPPATTSPPIPSVQPVQSDEHRVVFAPGTLPWAKPEHRVVFHRSAESDDNLTNNPELEELYNKSSDHPHVTEEGGIHHMLYFQHSDGYLSRGLGIRMESVKSNGFNVRRWPEYRGVYLPSQLTGDTSPTLHLFEQGRQHGDRKIYMFDGLVFDLHTSISATIHIPRTMLGADWLKCQTKNEYSASVNVTAANPCGDFIEGKTAYETVSWFGDDPELHAEQAPYDVTAYASRHRWFTPPDERGGRRVITDDEDFGEPVPLFVEVSDIERHKK